MSNTYTILITGSRDYRDTKIIRAAIINAIRGKPLHTIRLVHGKARGADTIAAFPLPQSKGTWDMIERAKRHGIQDIRIYEERT